MTSLLVGTVLTACGSHPDREAAPPAATSAPASASPTEQTTAGLAHPLHGARVIFRHTGEDAHYGNVAVVSLKDPRGPRRFLPITCDRVYATAEDASCVRPTSNSGTSYELDELDAHWRVTDAVPLPGKPSRTRLSPDGTLVATTTFVAAHSYMQRGFSTATEIRKVGGAGYGDLEEFRLVLDGREVTREDVNIWGVTFVDDNEFYATAATGGHTWLVHGDLSTRTLVSVRGNAECPSVSPDHTRVAYKVERPGPGKYWSIAVLDRVTGRQTVLRGERANVDDQVEWLDDDTLLYGLPRTAQPGITDVWAIDTRAGSRPRIFIKDAWSPAVVRP